MSGLLVRCKKCDDVIRSKDRHVMVWCKCGAIAVDGGDDYTRLAWPGGDPGDYVEFLEGEKANAKVSG